MAARGGAAARMAAILGTYVAAAILGRVDTGHHSKAREADEAKRGEHPQKRESEEQAPAESWKDVLWRLYSEVTGDRILLVAAGITFYGLLALFPALTALVSIYGLFADPAAVTERLQGLSGLLPGGAIEVIGGQLERVSSQPSGRLSLAFIGSLGVAIWTANNGVKAMLDGLNVAYDTPEERSFIRLTGVSLLFTLGALGAIIVGLAAIVLIPLILSFIGLGGAVNALISMGRWPLLLVLVVLAISVLYRYGPSRPPANWRWISPGSVAAGVLWVVASVLFSWYVANFGSYNETYGSLGAVIGFMVWMWISASIVLLGAELNAVLERETTLGGTSPGETRGREEGKSDGNLGQAAE